MRARILAVALVLSTAAVSAQAESVSHYLGRAVGGFGAGVGQAAMQPLADSQPQWVTVAPRSKTECLALTHQVLNRAYLRCRRGWQEYVRYDVAGRKVVLSERGIPRW
ncbi:hypothetical protein ACS8Y6_17560 [Salinisphaera sp. RV14]|uniref:hypothetical protein n=1 Tax=Salinisphaera sp. RV14 TaxID=3454140 RepID=UPI003F859116